MTRTALRAGLALIALAAVGAGNPARRGPEVDLRRPDPDQVTVSVVSGGEPLEWTGARLAGGDLNGDGLGDLVIAAPGGSDDRPSRRGRIYVLFGSLEPPARAIDLTIRYAPSVVPGGAIVSAREKIMMTQADVVIDGADDFDHLGISLIVTDLDADGFADIVAGAPRADGPADRRPDCGEVYVLHGAAIWPRRIDLAVPDAGLRAIRIIGAGIGDGLGASLAAADLDGDGRADLAMGAPGTGGKAGAMGALGIGAAVVVSAPDGGAAWPPLLDLAAPAGQARWVLRGTGAGDQAGYALATGDFDGDGIHDLAVGARGADGPGRPDAGEVSLIFGGTGLRPGLILARDADMTVRAADIGDLGGHSVLFGDLDGDGRDDLLVGVEFADGHRNARLDTGDVAVIRGRTRADVEALRPAPIAPEKKDLKDRPVPKGPVVIDLASGAAAGVVLVHGADPADHTGIRAVADLDGDGRAEAILGAADAASRRNGRAGGGEVTILRAPDGARREILLGDREGITLYGPQGNTHLGLAAAAVDLDGDGRPELALAGPQAGRSLEGKVWIVRADWGRLLSAAAAKGAPAGVPGGPPSGGL